jgi:hypothetical protein
MAVCSALAVSDPDVLARRTSHAERRHLLVGGLIMTPAISAMRQTSDVDGPSGATGCSTINDAQQTAMLNTTCCRRLHREAARPGPQAR